MSAFLAMWVTWCVVSLSGVMSPGPISALAIAEGAQRGPRAGPLITVGHALTELVMVLALGIGLREFLQRPPVAGTIGVIGGAVLFWMGYDVVRSSRNGPLALDAEAISGKSPGRLGPMPAGVLLSVGNPYWLLWWATVGAGYLLFFTRFGWWGIAAFYMGHISLDLIWNTLLATASASGKTLVSPSIYRLILGLCGLFMGAMGVYFTYTGLNLLRG